MTMMILMQGNSENDDIDKRVRVMGEREGGKEKRKGRWLGRRRRKTMQRDIIDNEWWREEEKEVAGEMVEGKENMKGWQLRFETSTDCWLGRIQHKKNRDLVSKFWYISSFSTQILDKNKFGTQTFNFDYM